MHDLQYKRRFLWRISFDQYGRQSICRYIQLGIYVRGYQDKTTRRFRREIAEVTEFYVTSDTNEARHNIIYRKGADGKVIRNNPSPYLIDYLEVQGVFLPKELQNMAGESYVESDSMKANAEVKENIPKEQLISDEKLMNDFTGESNQLSTSDELSKVSSSENQEDITENLFE